ncbi:isoprenyl transferase [Engelhardtia mirabilis]|uniref:Isoprenyl transferase n=1 Tax=Engelhardtia mirabilis TaxID=2528011 RepID=A0A518BPU4_9BACT|nr:Decaprenyl diphosphate synthase-like protein [Planctomycetes bacterium Pla133]QDV03325.1 Decaprenyl diphosphate synthase-like protein [Planctomycetes bacterium Pla86]
MTRPNIERPDFGGPFPEHIAIIMDGNGRWAQAQGLRRVFGHRRGARTVREITTSCAEMGVKSLTLYAFSVENWKRPRREVLYLMRLLKRYLVQERPTLMRNGVRLRAIGRVDDLPEDSLRTLRETERVTGENEGMLLRLALSYGSRAELADALKGVARDAMAGLLDPDTIDEQTMRRYLYDPVTPDPDLMIRTAGEMRLSNFLLWQASYAELHVADVCWPDFDRAQLLKALESYARRTRKFGGLVDAVGPGGDDGERKG